MKVTKVKVSGLASDPANVRLHSQRNVDAIAASLQRFGQQKPIVIDSAGVVRAGNGTLAAAIQLGWDTVNAVKTELEGSEATAYAIADNRTAELAEWDDEALFMQLQALKDEDPQLLADCAFTETELALLDVDAEFVENDASSEWDDTGVPAFDNPGIDSWKKVTLHIHSEEAMYELANLLKQKINAETRFIHYPPQKRIDNKVNTS